MFWGCTSLENLTFNKDNIGKNINCKNMFESCNALNNREEILEMFKK